jgi:predicted dehydrogenase
MTLFSYEDGMSGVFNHSGYLGPMYNYFIIRGTEGLLYSGRDACYLEDKRGNRKELTKPSEESAHQRMWLHFVSCLAGRTRPSYDTKRSLGDLEVFDAMTRSLREGESVRV